MTETYTNRRKALQARLATLGVAHAVVNNPINVLYLTGSFFNTRERFLALTLDVASGQTRLVLPAMEAGRLNDPAITEVPYMDGEDHIGLLCAGMKSGAGVGIEKDYLYFGRAEAIVERLGGSFAALTDIGAILAAQRLLKDAAEIETLQTACKITDEMLAAWKKHLRPGVKESELQFELTKLFSATEGAVSSFDAQTSTGVNTSVAHGISEERALQQGEQALIDFGVAYQYYHADITRVFFAGEPAKRWHDIYETVLKANLAGIAAVKPGVPIKNVDIAARQVIEEAGFGPYFTHRTGHGIGLEIHEDPYARGDNEQILQPGMVFTVEPGIYLPGEGGVRIEDDVLVTETGVRVLTSFPKTLADAIIC